MTSVDMFALDMTGDRFLEQSLVIAPIATYFWVRAYFQTVAKIHRETFQRRARGKVDFRGNKGEGHVRVYNVNERPEAGRDHWIAYSVQPTDKRITSAEQFDAISLDIYSLSQLAGQMQRDRAIRPRRVKKLAIPLDIKSIGGFGDTNVSWGRRKDRPWPFIYRRENPGAVLIARRSKASGKLLLYERIRKRAASRRRLRVGKKGQVLKSQPRVWVDALVPRWALVDVLVLKRSVLQFYETFDSMQAIFDRVYNRYMANLGRDIERGVVT